jgi:spore coat protein D
MYCKPCFGGPSYVSPVATGPVMTTPPVVHPAKYCETHTFSTTVVPHIHPTHTTLVNHQMIQNQHYFPQTNSAVNQVQQTNVPGYGPGPGVPYGPGAVAPYGPGPGGPYGPGPQVAGAMTGPMPGMVAGAATGNMGPNANPMVGGMFKR